MRATGSIPTSPGESSGRTGTVFMVVLRVVFVLALSAVGGKLAYDVRIVSGAMAGQGDLILIGSIGAALIVMALDIFVARKSLAAMGNTQLHMTVIDTGVDHHAAAAGGVFERTAQ